METPAVVQNYVVRQSEFSEFLSHGIGGDVVTRI